MSCWSGWGVRSPSRASSETVASHARTDFAERRRRIRLPAHSGDANSSGSERVVYAVLRDRPPEQRLAAPEQAAQRLAVAVPELGAAQHPAEGAAGRAQHRHVQRQVEPDQRVGRLGHHGAELALVAAVDHPAFAGDDGRHLGAELLEVRLGPVRAVVHGVQLDVRNAEPAGQLGRERGLARPADPDHPHAPHAANLVHRRTLPRPAGGVKHRSPDERGRSGAGRSRPRTDHATAIPARSASTSCPAGPGSFRTCRTETEPCPRGSASGSSAERCTPTRSRLGRRPESPRRSRPSAG